MRTRVKDPGARNIVGAKVEQRRKALNLRQKDFLIRLQSAGMDINASGLSKLEGQFRFVTDMELKALALTLGVKVDWLLGIENETR